MMHALCRWITQPATTTGCRDSARRRAMTSSVRAREMTAFVCASANGPARPLNWDRTIRTSWLLVLPAQSLSMNSSRRLTCPSTCRRWRDALSLISFIDFAFATSCTYLINLLTYLHRRWRTKVPVILPHAHWERQSIYGGTWKVDYWFHFCRPAVFCNHVVINCVTKYNLNLTQLQGVSFYLSR